jgi:hypothetical protein
LRNIASATAWSAFTAATAIQAAGHQVHTPTLCPFQFFGSEPTLRGETTLRCRQDLVHEHAERANFAGDTMSKSGADVVFELKDDDMQGLAHYMATRP